MLKTNNNKNKGKENFKEAIQLLGQQVSLQK
jgi:hypothetical protein